MNDLDQYPYSGLFIGYGSAELEAGRCINGHLWEVINTAQQIVSIVQF